MDLLAQMSTTSALAGGVSIQTDRASVVRRRVD